MHRLSGDVLFSEVVEHILIVPYDRWVRLDDVQLEFEGRQSDPISAAPKPII